MTDSFEIGLVMAGAISAGAYTAGVVDFLIQALDEWYKAKERYANGGSAVPSHDVVLKVISGASAGGLTAAIATNALATNCPPVTDVTAERAADNKLFDSWVNRIDVQFLLQTRDLGKSDAQVMSCSTQPFSTKLQRLPLQVSRLANGPM